MRYQNHYTGSGYYASQLNSGEDTLYTYPLGSDERQAERLVASMGLGTIFEVEKGSDLPSPRDEQTPTEIEKLQALVVPRRNQR